MKPLSNKTASRPGYRAEASERYVRTARLAILWERLWRASWPATGLLGLFIAAALFGLFENAPQWLHLSLLFLVVLAAGSFLHQNLMDFKLPRWEDGARRVEQDSALAHRPISEANDRLAAGMGDPWTEELWRAHLKQLLARIAGLKVRWPRPGLQKRDRYALRFVTLLLVVGGFVWAGSDAGKRLAVAFTPDSGTGASAASLDAWINPPAYTGEAPIYLQHPADGEGVAVPVGSELVLRVHAARGLPNLALEPEPDDRTGKFAGSSGEYGTNVVITRDRFVRVLADGKLLAHFAIKAIPDDPPHIAFIKPPAKTAHDAVAIAFTAGDDYGVVSARAIIRPVARNARAVLSVDLPLTPAKTLSQTVYRDLTGEPLAGADVSIVLEAKDGAGQTGRSKPAYMKLPARVFINPLARALVEQRQNLAIGAPHARDNAELALDALSIAPDKFYAQQTTAYLAIRTAFWSLKNARSDRDIRGVEQLLWDTAVSLEQGGLLTAAEELRRLQQMLTEALEQGAPQEVIDALLDRYKQALQRYLQSLAQNGPQPNDQMSSNSRTITPADLDALLKAIEQMSQTGSRDAAAKALAMLQDLLENLHAGNGSGGPPTDKALSDAIQGLGDIIGRQRQLLDKTYRQQQGAGDPKDGGGKGLSGGQGKLREDLDKIAKGLGAGKTPKNLGDAGRQMQDAQGQLGANDFDNAEQSEKNALQAMQDTADALAKKMMEEAGQSGQQNQGQDPLGRAEGTTGPATGSSGVKIPDRDELARARSILEELRRRAAERGRPKEELDYYDRLLKEF
ncbi:MAG TPA: TIGR02302 family protein [Rhizomicrobium sp.]|nr:TIGR02302 family protein [Rhizomicrobium sp.]